MIRRSAVNRGTLSEDIKKQDDKKEYEKQQRINKKAESPLTQKEEAKLRVKAPRIDPIIANVFNKGANASVLAKVYPVDSKWYPLIQELSKYENSLSPIT